MGYLALFPGSFVWEGPGYKANGLPTSADGLAATAMEYSVVAKRLSVRSSHSVGFDLALSLYVCVCV